MTPRRSGHTALALILVSYGLLATAYGVAIPLWEAPDAIWHYQFVAHLASGGGLPTRVEEGKSAPWRQEGSQPPLYYLAAMPWVALVRPADADAVIHANPHANVGVTDPGGNLNSLVHGSAEAWPWHGTVLAARLVGLAGLLWGLVTVLATWALAHATFPDRPAVANLAAALVAFNPQFVFMSTAISNDVAAAATAALALWAMVTLWRHGPSRWRLMMLGVAVGLAALSKLSGLWLGALGVVAVLGASWQRPRPSAGGLAAGRPPARTRVRAVVGDLAWMGIPALVVGGWWYARNWWLFGDATGLPLMLSVMTPRAAAPGVRELAAEAVAIWKSFWGVFGWFNVPAPDWVHVLATLLVGVGLAGLVIALVKRRVPRDSWPGLGLAAVWCLAMIGAVYWWARVQYPQGRLLFPLLSALALLVATGLLLPLPARAQRWVVVGVACGLAGVSVWLLPKVILPAYAAPTSMTGTPRDAAAGDSVTYGKRWFPPARFGEVAELASVDEMSFDPDGGTAHPGELLTVTFGWHVLSRPDRNWSIFLHLVDEDGVVVAQRDSYPGGGAWPTVDWRPGQMISDTHRLVIPFTAGSPACEFCRLRVGLYDAATGERLPLDSDTDELQLGGLIVHPRLNAARQPQLPQPAHFGDEIVLDGYALHRRALDAGQKLKVTLYWRALAMPTDDYRVSVQLRRGDTIAAQADFTPADDTRPTSGWRPGEIIVDAPALRVPKTTPPGDYTLHVALYPPDGRPLPVDFRDPDFSLGPVRVTARE